MAHTLKIPLIRMIDGTGGGGSVKTLEDIGATYVPATPGWGEIVKNLVSLRLPVLVSLSAYANAIAQRDIPLDRFIAAYFRDRGVDLPCVR